MNDAVKKAWADAWNGLLLRLIQSPGTTIGGALSTLGGLGLTFADDYPHVLKAAKLCLALGVGLMGLNATSHGFVGKQSSGNTVTLNKADVPSAPATDQAKP